jgi:hypothetical protein
VNHWFAYARRAAQRLSATAEQCLGASDRIVGGKRNSAFIAALLRIEEPMHALDRRAQSLDAAAMRGPDCCDDNLEKTAAGSFLQRRMRICDTLLMLARVTKRNAPAYYNRRTRPETDAV